MYYEPLTRRGALIVRSMWDVFRKINLVTSMRRCPEFQFIPIIDRAFAFQKVSDGLNTLVIVDLRFCPGRHRQNVHANLLRAYCLSGGPSSITKALLPNVGFARLKLLEQTLLLISTSEISEASKAAS
jgi:hypothetical protein